MTTEGAAIDTVVTGYAFVRLAMPTNPSRPEPKSQRAGGMGTAVGENSMSLRPSLMIAQS